MYHDQLRPAHNAALHAQQLTLGIRSALTQQQHRVPDEPFADQQPDLGPVLLPEGANSYR